MTVSNFFDTDEKIAVGVDVLDTEAMDHVMKQWRAEAHKMMLIIIIMTDLMRSVSFSLFPPPSPPQEEERWQ